MGGENSKRCGSLASVSGTSSVGIDFPNNCRREADATAWTLLHQCTVDKWKDINAEAAGFREVTLLCTGTLNKDCSDSFCVSRQGIINMHKATSFFLFRKRSKFAKMAEHFEYNHIPAQLSSIHHLRVLSILCYREKLVVLHVSKANKSQLGLLDLKCNKFLGVFGQLTQNNELSNRNIRARLSTDCSRLVVLLAQSNQLQVYCTRSKILLNELNVSAFGYFSFDPRFSWSHLAITSYSEPNNLSILDLSKNNQVIASNARFSDDSLGPDDAQQLQHTPDGSLVIITLLRSICTCDMGRSTRITVTANIYVFDAITAMTLHCIRYERNSCSIHSCLVNHTPIFSDCGSRMAMVVNSPGIASVSYVQVYKLPKMSVNLQRICRVVILQNFSDLTNLQLPKKLIDFLQFKPEFE